MSRSVADARAHELFLEVRGDEPPSRRRFMAVGWPPIEVLDFCVMCDSHGPITEEGLCPDCADDLGRATS